MPSDVLNFGIFSLSIPVLETFLPVQRLEMLICLLVRGAAL